MAKPITTDKGEVKALRKSARAVTTVRRSKESPAELEAAIARFADLKAQAAVLSASVAEAQEEVLRLMDKAEKNSVTVTREGEQVAVITATVVRGTSQSIDPDRLKRALGADLWKKVTTAMLDKRKLDAFIKSGEIKATTVAKVTEVSNNKPYVKITKK